MSQTDKLDPRVNDQILRFFNDLPRLKEVRLIDNEGNAVGIVTAQQALENARKLNLDLIEIAPQAQPPVCKIMDYGKYKYQQSKRLKEQQTSQKQSALKTLTFGMTIEKHDFQVKINNAIKFLQHGDKVKILIKFKGREINYAELSNQLVNRIIDAVGEISTLEKSPTMEGKFIYMILAPKVK